MRRKLNHILSICFISFILLIGCRKVDLQREKPVGNLLDESVFFDRYQPTDPTVIAFRSFVQRENLKTKFALKYLKVVGIPHWDKAMVFNSARKGDPLRSDANVTANDSTIIYVPFARDSQSFVNSILIMKAVENDTTMRVLYDWEYKYFEPSTSNDLARNAHGVFYLFANLDRHVFGTTQFKLTDKYLFTEDMLSDLAQNNIDPDSVVVNVTLGGQNVVQGRFMISTTTCEELTYCVQWKRVVLTSNRSGVSDNPSFEATHGPQFECIQLGNYTQCNTTWSYDDAGWSGPNPDPGGSGGGGGGGLGDPTNPNPCSPVPGTQPRGPIGGLDPCGGTGWEPLIPDPPSDPLNDLTSYRVDADFHGNRTYVTPAGVAITLPPGAKIRYYTNFDVNIFPNGAMYAFEIPNPLAPEGFDVYVAYQQEYLAPGAIIIPKPEFKGYYKVNPTTKKINWSAPYPTSSYNHAQPDENNVIKSVRVRINKKPNGQCEIIREFADVTPTSSIPTSAGTVAKVNYSIELAPLSNQSPTEATNLQSCPGENVTTGDPTMNVTEFAVIYGTPLKNFLNERLKTDVKIYLKNNCGTGATAGYTINKSGVQSQSSTQMTNSLNKLQNNGAGLTASDEQVAITGCISNGKWTFSAVINSTRMGQVHEKFANNLQSAEVALQEAVSKEVAQLRGVGKIADQEVYTLPNGDKFFISQMGFFEKLASLYDLGYHVIKNGSLPETVWDRGRRNGPTDLSVLQAYEKSPFGLPPFGGGLVNQLIEDAAGGIMLLQTGVELLSRPAQTFDNLKKAVSELNWEKAKAMLNEATGIDNYNAGGDRASYQGGKHTVQAATIFIRGITTLTGKARVKKAGDDLVEVQKFVPDGVQGASISEALQNAYLNDKAVTNISNEKLLTKNVEGSQEFTVVIEKNSPNEVKIYKANDTELIDHRSGVAYSPDEILESAKDVNKPKSVSSINGKTIIETDAGTTGGWNKELNNAKPNSEYVVKNSGLSGHKYTTDALGRVIKVEGELTLNTRNRNGYQQSVKCKGLKDGLQTDHGGHLIASRFDGAGEQINLVPMKSELNLGAWKAMENEWALASGQGMIVKVEVRPVYLGNSNRPAGFEVDYWVNNQKTSRIFAN